MANEREAELELRKQQAVDLRVAGYSYREISKRLGVSLGAAFKDVKDSVAEAVERRKEDSSHVLEVELARLDEATKLCIETLAGQDLDTELRLKAVDRLAKISEQRSKLLGLYAPQKVEQTISEDVSPQKIRDAVRNRFGGAVAPEIDDDADADASDSADG